MLQRNYCMDILLENATSFTEKSKLHSLTEAEQAVVNDRMVGNLYQSALKKKNINFDNIPSSKGDIQKVDGYENMVGTLNVLKGLCKKFGMVINEIDIVEDAINHIRIQKPIFEKGFKLNVDFLQTHYNALVYACIEGTSLILSSYVDYVKTVNSIEFQLRKGKGVYGNVCIDSLDKFNKSIKDGSFVRLASGLLDKGQENFLGTATKVISAARAHKKHIAIAMLAANIIPITRELIYYFYESRMNASEYLQQQKEFLEMNKFKLESTNMDAQKRNKILDKQQKSIIKLQQLSDKIKVNNQLANKNAMGNIKQDNKQWNVSNVANDDNGFTFI